MSFHVNRETLSASAVSMALFDSPEPSSLAANVVVSDTAALKSRLAAMIDDLQKSSPADAQKYFSDLCVFFDTVAEQSGTHIQNIFGQHVAGNVLAIVMNSVVKPLLGQYCRVVGRRRGTTSRCADSSGFAAAAAASRRRRETSSSKAASVAAQEEMDAYMMNKAEKLRSDVIRPWRALVETLHRNLPTSLFVSSLGVSNEDAYVSSSSAAAGGGANGNRGAHRGLAAYDVATSHSPHKGGEWKGSLTARNTAAAGGGGSISTIANHDSYVLHLWDVPPNHTSLPLLWKNGTPFFSLIQHAVEVFQSNVLVAVCGQDYAKMLQRLFLFHGYLSNLQPAVIMELTIQLLGLIERTEYEKNNGINTTDKSKNAAFPVSTSMAAETTTTHLFPSDNRNSNHNAFERGIQDDGSYHPSIDQGTVFAALLVQIFRAPQLMSAFTPCEDEADLCVSASKVNSNNNSNNNTIPFILRRLTRLTTQRHMCPTDALCLETHLLVGLNLLVSMARDDYPSASTTPLELVKSLCHLFYATKRREGWRMEAFTFMTTQICVCFSSLLGKAVREDIQRHRPLSGRYPRTTTGSSTTTSTYYKTSHGDTPSHKKQEQEENVKITENSLLVSPMSLTLLHETVLPFLLQFFTVTRNEFNHISRRELFHFPCSPLSPLLDFGAVVVYLACSTYEAYMTLPFSSSSADIPLSTSGSSSGNHETTVYTVVDDSPIRTDVTKAQQRKTCTKRSRVDDINDNETTSLHINISDHTRRKTRPKSIPPGDTLLQLFRSLFFLDNLREDALPKTADSKEMMERTGDVNAPIAKEDIGTDSLMRVSAAAGGSLSAAAVEELVKDGSLFMLHLFAQPGTTLGFTEQQCSLLVEYNILPLFPYYGVRLEALLFSVLLAVAPRTSLACQQNVFRWLVRRYMHTVTRQRDDENPPKEQVYQLLALLLGRGVVGRYPFFLHNDERARLQAAAHFSTITAQIRAVVYGESSKTMDALLTEKKNTEEHATALQPAMKTSLIVAVAAAGHKKKSGLSTALFMAMLEFLSMYHHYGATSAEICMAQRMADKINMHSKDVKKDRYLMDLPSSAVHLTSGISFLISAVSHAVCFFPHDEGVIWRHDTDTSVGASTCAAVFLQALRWSEEYLLASCLIATENELGWQHSLAVKGGSVNDSSKNMETLRGHGNGKTMASLQRMKELLGKSRLAMDMACVAPQKHVPTAVYQAAEGHWLLLHDFIASFTEETRTAMDAVGADNDGVADDGEKGDNRDMDDSGFYSGRLHRGDVPLCLVEVLAGEVARAIGEMSERVKMVGMACTDITPGPSLHQQPFREVDEEAVAMAHRTICIHAVQLLHLILRLYRLGIWQLPYGHHPLNSKRTESNNNNNNNNNNKGACDVDLDDNVGGTARDESGDLNILSSIPQTNLFDKPISIFPRLSPEGRMYYAVMWICRHLATRLLRGAVVRDRVLMRVLLLLMNDVGVVLLSQSFALWEPRQVILSFVGVVCRHTLDEGIKKIALWRPTNATSADAVAAVHTTMRLSCSLLRVVLIILRRTHVLAASADPLVNPGSVTAAIVHILEKDGLIPEMNAHRKDNANDDVQPHYGQGRNENVESATRENVLKLNPLLPFSLAAVDGFLELLQVLHETYNDIQARLATRCLLETLFARYRYGLSESIFSAFSHYAPLHQGFAMSTVVDMNCEGEEETEEEEESEENERHNTSKRPYGVKHHEVRRPPRLLHHHTRDDDLKGIKQRKKEGENEKDYLLLKEGRLLEMFIDQLTDVSRHDMPVLTPKLQCTVLSSIYGLLFRSDALVAEKLGKYLFSFLSIKTAYAVRRHTALHVRWLFNRFTHRTYNVLQELLYCAREGISSISPMHCATSLRALGEAAHAAPMLEADIICTLLECWATRGFAHKGLLLECMELIGSYIHMREGGFSTTAMMSGTTKNLKGMSAQQLCYYHSERLLFDWMWRLGHPMEAFPIACFGYTNMQEMWQAFMPTLLPLALLCSARGNGAQVAEEEEEESVVLRPSDLLWRLTACYKRSVDTTASGSARTREVLVECIKAYFPDIMARLFIFAALSKRHGRRVKKREKEKINEEVANAAHVVLEWMRTTCSTEYTVLIQCYADAILCHFVDLVGTMAPLVRVRQMHQAVIMLCELVAEGSSISRGAQDEEKEKLTGKEALRGSGRLLDLGFSSVNVMTTVVDAFFARNGGDHAYVLLQQLYVGLTHDVHRGSRRAMLALLFEDIVKHWWSWALLQKVPHILHTVLRLCGNILMTCVDARSHVCNVLLYVWTMAMPPPASTSFASCSSSSSVLSRGVLAADEVFISTVMLTLAKESRIISSTWAAIRRAGATLERQDWKLQYAKYTQESLPQNKEDEEEEKLEERKGNNVIVTLLDGIYEEEEEAEQDDDDCNKNKQGRKREQQPQSKQEGKKKKNNYGAEDMGATKDTACNLKQDNNENDSSNLSIHEAIERVTNILPLLQSAILDSGAPASSFYTDAASAVDRARSAFVKLIQVYIHNSGDDRTAESLIHKDLTTKNAGTLGMVQMVYETCCRAVKLLLTLVCMDDVPDVSSQAMITGTSVASMSFTRSFKLQQATHRDAQLSAFRLLRALCWCFIKAGAEAHVDALLYPITAIQGMLQECPIDDVLHRIYRQHVEELYRLAFDADAYVAHVASTTLRGWLCGITADDNTENNGGGDGDKNVNKCMENVSGNNVILTTAATRAAASNNNNKRRQAAGDDGHLIKSVLELFCDEGNNDNNDDNNKPTGMVMQGKEAEKKKETQKEPSSSSSLSTLLLVPPPVQPLAAAPSREEAGTCFSKLTSGIKMEDISPFRRQLVGVFPYKHLVDPDDAGLKVASLLDDLVWDALIVHEDEPRFLRLFIIALIRHYNLHHRFCTVATVLRSLLLRPFSNRSGSLMSFMESFLPILLIHTMLLKETESQRSQRVAWSQLLELHIFRKAHVFRHTTRLFLRALNVCHSVLMTVVRSHGVKSDSNNGSIPFSRLQPFDLETTTTFLTFPFFVRSKYGDLPELSDMRESYWLSDIDPLILASAAVTCQESHLAVLFTELSGESLLGRRKGIPSAAVTIVGQPKCSVLFPLKRPPSSSENGVNEGHGVLSRRDKAEAEMMERLATYRAAVHAILVDVETLMRFRDVGYNDNTTRSDTDALGTTPLPRHTHNTEDADVYMTPWEEAFFLQHPARLIELEKNRGNWKAVLVLLDRIEDSLRSTIAGDGGGRPMTSGTTKYNGCGFTRSRLLVEKANALLQLGAADSALQMLASALKRRFPNSVPVASDMRQGKKNEEEEEQEEGEQEEDYYLQIRSALAGILWRLGRWDVDCIEDAEGEQGQEQQQHHPSLVLPSLVSVEEGIFFAMRCIHRGEHHNVRRWITQTQERLLCQFDATNWFSLMLQAEALHDIEECGRRLSQWNSSSSSSSSSLLFPSDLHNTSTGVTNNRNISYSWEKNIRAPPPWIYDSLANVHGPYRELELLDNVHQRLCVMYCQPQWWLSHLEKSSERALCSNRPILVRQWLSAYTEFNNIIDTSPRGERNEGIDSSLLHSCNVFQNLTTSHDLPAIAFLALLQARAEFASGRPHRAIAILQNTEMKSSDLPPFYSSASSANGFLFPMPTNAPQMPVIVQQLVAWAREVRLVPLSQLVRDPFLLLSVKNDHTGICCLQLARLCHTLVRDIATRLHSEEYRKLRESIEASHRMREELEQRNEMSDGLSDAEKKILQRRIRTLAVETTREEDEWQREAEAYALYRRSALNAYARFMERSDPAESDSLLAVFAFVSLWLQQDERLDERHLRGASSAVSATSGVIKKAIKNIPSHKFLPLFSQLVAQLGTSLDNTNLEKIVLCIAMESPLHTVWPLLALAHGDVFGPSMAKSVTTNGGSGLHAVDRRKVTLARRILCTMKAPNNPSNANLVDDKNHIWREQIVNESEKLSAAYIQLAFYRVHNKSRPTHRIPEEFMIIDKNLRNLLIPPPTLTLSFSSSSPPSVLSSCLQDIAKIVHYETTFTTPGGINLPKALRCVLSDGRIVRQLLKSEDDLRQDSLIEQVFCLSNQLLAKNRGTSQLHIWTYNVVPLAPTVGIIEWVDGTIPLGQYLNGESNGGGGGGAEYRRRYQTGAHERYFPGEPTTLDCRAKLQSATKTQKHSVLLDLYTEFSPALHYFFLEHFFTPQEWLERREAYTRSVAASSIIGYIVGLGDRHGNNLLLHTRQAKLVHIDLGFAFDQGKLLPVPELVPFRLTRNVVDGFGVQGTEGPFRRCCEGTLRVLRGQKELLMTILEACAHDPLARWAVTGIPSQRLKQQQQQQQRPHHVLEEEDEEDEDTARKAASPRQRDLGVSRGKPSYADAERTLSHVAEKIDGYESGELLSVPTHVHKLLQTAQNTELLAHMFVGWSPWL